MDVLDALFGRVAEAIGVPVSRRSPPPGSCFELMCSNPAARSHPSHRSALVRPIVSADSPCCSWLMDAQTDVQYFAAPLAPSSPPPARSYARVLDLHFRRLPLERPSSAMGVHPASRNDLVQLFHLSARSQRQDGQAVALDSLWLHDGLVGAQVRQVLQLSVSFSVQCSRPKSSMRVSHIYRYVANIPLSTIEITGAQMVLTMKLTTFAWNLYDGQRPISQLDKVQVASRVPALPPLLDFTGFALFFPGVLVGPSFGYATYDAFLKRSLFAKADKRDGRRRPPPGRFTKMTQRLLTGLAMMGLFALYGGKYGFERLLEPEFESKSFLFACVVVALWAPFFDLVAETTTKPGNSSTDWLIPSSPAFS
jgi:MBOAT, membrane-bound O-acyltransferase family